MAALDREALDRFIEARGLRPDFREKAARLHAPLAECIAGAVHRARCQVVGLCGPQGSGKSTAAALIRQMLDADGLRTALLSLDDLYLTRDERLRLAAEVDPLLITRGPPGTHDVGLGLQVLEGLLRPGTTRIPRFDKAADDRKPLAEWDEFEGPADVVLFEGWCVGAGPQAPEELARAVNHLERTRDPQGRWRAYVNAALAGAYQDLFGRIDLLVLMLAPSFETVVRWRQEQERKLREAAPEGAQVMSDAEVAAFVKYYERLTRHIAEEMPARADVLIRLDSARRPVSIGWPAP